MQRIFASEAAGERVYQELKARVISYEFPQGERIYLEPIASSLGVSTTPVREALNRLAAEALVIKAPRKGFFSMTLSEDNLVGHYELTRLLLTHELGRLQPSARRKLSECEPVARILRKLNQRQITDADVLASYTGQLFSCIASLSENVSVRLSIDTANDHLHFIRTLECQHWEHAQSELMCMCELLLAGECDEMIAAVHEYHDQRLGLLPSLLELLQR